MSFDIDLFGIYTDVCFAGIATGFTIGFISWAIGLAIDTIILLIKRA